MTLSDVLRGVTVTNMFQMLYGKMVVTHELTVGGLRYDSRAVEAGDLFVALRGAVADGHRFVPAALAAGAVAVVVEDDAAVPDSLCMHAGAVKIVVPETRKALAVMAANVHGRPADHLLLAGVTGTNGKTTTAHLLASILEAHGTRTGVIGTIGHLAGGERIPAVHTTPEAPELHGLLAAMVRGGCGAAVMEVSSHALAQDRVYGLPFAAGVFTNLTQDHLDFHGTMDRYLAAKRMLFTALAPRAVAVVNAGDPSADRIVAGTGARIVRYGVSVRADVAADPPELSLAGIRLQVRGSSAYTVTSSLVGAFNAENILAACAAGEALGVPPDAIARGVAALPSVRGRFERVHAPDGRTAVVDYAHTPDALERCLRTIRGLLPAGGGGRIITVFGCGGDRDRGKRPLMGRIASELSDVTIITSDNPRREDPAAIIAAVREGAAPGAAVTAEPDRRAAIRRGIALARPGDVVLVAGKGHETVQVIGDETLPFDDRAEVEYALGLRP